MNDVFLHNPRCSKSRAALDPVRETGAEVPIREYLQDPLSVDELRRLVQLLGVRPIAITRRSERQFQVLGLSDTTPDEEVLHALAEHPILVERQGAGGGGAAAGEGKGDIRRRGVQELLKCRSKLLHLQIA